MLIIQQELLVPIEWAFLSYGLQRCELVLECQI